MIHPRLQPAVVAQCSTMLRPAGVMPVCGASAWRRWAAPVAGAGLRCRDLADRASMRDEKCSIRDRRAQRHGPASMNTLPRSPPQGALSRRHPAETTHGAASFSRAPRLPSCRYARLWQPDHDPASPQGVKVSATTRLPGKSRRPTQWAPSPQLRRSRSLTAYAALATCAFWRDHEAHARFSGETMPPFVPRIRLMPCD